MVALIFYFDSLNMISQTLEDLCDKTDIKIIEKIIICNDSGQLLEDLDANGLIRDKIEILDSSNIGRARAWSLAVVKTEQKDLVFIGGITKFGEGWLTYLLRDLNDNNIVTPLVHLLDVNIWQSLNNRWERFGWRWDFNLSHRQLTDINKSTPSVSCYCLAIAKTRYDQLGGWDTGMDAGSGEDIELSLRNWIMGGSCIISEQSTIATAAHRKSAGDSLRNINRIVQAWLPEYEDNVKAYYAELPAAGKINNLIKLEEQRTKTNLEVLRRLQPELLGVYELRRDINGKSLALIAPGASFDYLNRTMINRNEVLIGIDYMGMLIDCDYVITDNVNIIKELKKKYAGDKFILPMIISNKILGKHELAEEVCPGCHLIEQKQYGQLDISVNPPFVDVDNIAITALNIALFFKPEIINIYGLDYRLINGRSHTSHVGYYDDGMIMPETETTKTKYEFNEYVLHKLGDLAIANNTPVIRVNHL